MKSLHIFLLNLLILPQFFWLTPGIKAPCEDFYEYACRNYSRDNPDPNYKEITQKLDYEFNKKLLEHMDNESIVEDEQTFCDKMLVYLESCKRETERDLKKYFKEITPGCNLKWPLLENKTRQRQRSWLGANETFDYWSLLGQLHSYGLNDVIVKYDIQRNKEGMLDIWLAPFEEEEEGTLPDNTIIENLLKILGIEQTQTIIQELHDFDSKLKRFNDYFDNTEIKNITFNQMLNVKLYLENLLGPQEVNKISLITIQNPKYFKYLNTKSWNSEELENICNYLMTKFLYYLAKDSAADFTPFDCMKDLRRKFDLAVNFYYFHEFFIKEETEYTKEITKLFTQIKTTITKYFEKDFLKLNCHQKIYLEWKLHEIKINIGNLPDNPNHYMLDSYYRDIPQLDKGNYFRNHLSLLKHRFRKSLIYNQNQSHFVVSDNRMGAVSTPYYAVQQNMVVIPFGSLQLPLYHYSQTPLEQLPLFGFVLAHELTHAFDTTGLNFDQHGLPLDPPSDILTNQNFQKALTCMQHQDYTENIDERIADLFAVRVVYRIYYDNYSYKGAKWRRRFFVNMAQFFCGKDNIEFIDHDSDAQRLQQIVKNFRPFAKAFGCSKKRSTKCRIY